MKTTLKTLLPTGLLLGTALLLVGCGGSSSGSTAAAVDTDDAKLVFNPASGYTDVNVTVDGTAMKVRQYKIVYVANPIRMAETQPTLMGGTTTMTDPYAYQTMYVSVPEQSLNDQKAPIYFAVNNGGWWTSAVKTTINEGASFANTSDSDNIGRALKAGYIVVNVGTRSRGAAAEDGSWAGKAPSPVVDGKAAIRYLRLNDKVMAGSAERIICNSTSGGGGLTSAIAASGNSADYYPYLSEIGAAGIMTSGSAYTSTLKDDVFAAVAYCPINNLGNADIGYEWQYSAIRSDANTGTLGGVAYSAGLQPAASTALAALFPTYLNGLALEMDDYSLLTDASMRGAIVQQLKEEIERQIRKGVAMPAIGENFVFVSRGSTVSRENTWLTVSGSGVGATVSNIDYDKFLAFVANNQALKTVVAFDAAGVTGNPNVSGETNLFGRSDQNYCNFTEWTWNSNIVSTDGVGYDNTSQTWAQYLATADGANLAQQIKLINPIAYLTGSSATPAPHWYIRHGMVDRDTAFAMQVMLYYAVKNNPKVQDVSFKLPYLTGHSGNYDVTEVFNWIKTMVDNNPL